MPNAAVGPDTFRYTALHITHIS